MSCDQDLFTALPWPSAEANKYSRGKLVVVAGSARYPGAAALAARAAQRMGAGYTEVIAAPESVDTIRACFPSLVVRPWSEWKPSELPAFAEGKPCAVCIGPGFVPDDEFTAGLVVKVLRKAACPVLVDGGALVHLATRKALAALRERVSEGWATVITPHGGEAARLAESLSVPKGAADRLAAGLALATGAIVVLKGPDTHIYDGRRADVMTEGGSALAKAGTGDVLAGMVSALLAQGVPAYSAAHLGALLHARAGNMAAQALTDIAVTPEDVIEALPAVLKQFAR